MLIVMPTTPTMLLHYLVYFNLDSATRLITNLLIGLYTSVGVYSIHFEL